MYNNSRQVKSPPHTMIEILLAQYYYILANLYNIYIIQTTLFLLYQYTI